MQRIFIPGDKWLYYKIYSGVISSDDLIKQLLYPLCIDLYNKCLINKWFFIRYNDPENHLRWRIHSNNTHNIGKIMESVFKACKTLFDTGYIHKIQADTYKREFERYGINLIEQTETMFWHESQMIAKILERINGLEEDKTRWLFSLRAIDQLLDDFKYPKHRKFNLLKKLSEDFGKEFNINSSLIIQLSNKYRVEKKNISDILDRINDNQSPYLQLFKLLKVKSDSTSNIISKILDLKMKNELHIPIDNLLSSYIHMFMNRLFRSKQRIHELVIYGFLFRYYRTLLAREKYNK